MAGWLALIRSARNGTGVQGALAQEKDGVENLRVSKEKKREEVVPLISFLGLCSKVGLLWPLNSWFIYVFTHWQGIYSVPCVRYCVGSGDVAVSEAKSLSLKSLNSV